MVPPAAFVAAYFTCISLVVFTELVAKSQDLGGVVFPESLLLQDEIIENNKIKIADSLPIFFFITEVHWFKKMDKVYSI
jgi:hypothetical protein